MQNDNELVSCTVISYNSATTVIETLDSIYAQTYQNIELIVSDDCSTDNTVELCRDWIEQHKDRFVRTELLTIDHNTGVSGNGNRVANACRGEWQKGLGADDILLPNCVEDNIAFANEHPEANWIASYVRYYRETFEEKNCTGRMVAHFLPFYEKSAEEQLKEIAKHNVIVAPSLFMRLSFRRSIGYNEAYGFEDVPFYVDALERGDKCFFLPKETVGYRIHESISNSSEKLFNYKSLLEFRRFREDRLFKYLTKRQIRGQRRLWKIQDYFELHGLNKKTRVMCFVYKIVLAFYFKLY